MHFFIELHSPFPLSTKSCESTHKIRPEEIDEPLMALSLLCFHFLGISLLLFSSRALAPSRHRSLPGEVILRSCAASCTVLGPLRGERCSWCLERGAEEGGGGDDGSGGEELKRCSGCKEAWYCAGTKCQKHHWPVTTPFHINPRGH